MLWEEDSCGYQDKYDKMITSDIFSSFGMTSKGIKRLPRTPQGDKWS